MTNETDSTTTGAAYELANGGYLPMPDPHERDDSEPIGGDSASLRDAAAGLGDVPDEIVVRGYTGPDGDPVPATEAVTLSRASRDYAAVTAAERLVAENENAKALAARVDALRAEAFADDPEAAEIYGFDPPQVNGDTASDKADAQHRGSETEVDTAATSALDPELEKALQHPQVRHAIEEQLGEVEKARQTYLGGLAAATQIAQVSFLSQFPELANTAPEALPGILEQMSRQDPEKFERVRGMVAATEQLFEQQRVESGRQAERTRQNFENYAQAEDARFESTLKGESKKTQAAVYAEIMASAKASGIEPAELNLLFSSEPLMRHATFQRMMYDAGKYRLMLRARDEAVARPLPPVVRPGTARTPAERQHADLRTLNAKLSSSGDIKDAVALYHARKSGKR